MIEASEITRNYGPLRAVDELSFTVPRGSVCGFLGPNGAGKSTTIRMITGLIPPDSGALRVGGTDVGRDPNGVRRQIGYLPETNPLDLELRVEEYLRFRGRLMGLNGRGLLDAIARSLDLCGLEGVQRRLIGALSKGFRQRVGLAAALVADPPLLVLDEPTVGLDPVQQSTFRSLLESLANERTVLLSSHLLAEVEASCNWLVMISGGRLVATGSRNEVMAGVAGAPVVMEVSGEDPMGFRDRMSIAEGIDGVTTHELDGDWTRLLFTASDGLDHRERLIQEAVRDGLRIREVRQERQTLEAVFLALAGGSDTRWSDPKEEGL